MVELFTILVREVLLEAVVVSAEVVLQFLECVTTVREALEKMRRIAFF